VLLTSPAPSGDRLTVKEVGAVVHIKSMEVRGEDAGCIKNIEGATSNVEEFLREHGEEMGTYLATEFEKKKAEEAAGARAT
jgi:hypothetical protein